LVKKNKIVEVKVRSGKRGAPRTLYQIPNAKPGIKHEFYVDWLVEKLQNKGVDCVKSRIGPDIQIAAQRLAINVETGNSDIEGNIWIALSQFSKVIVCSDDEELIQALSRQKRAPNVLCSLVWDVPDLCSKKSDLGSVTDFVREGEEVNKKKSEVSM
jgi:hypothetical protein